MSKKLFSILAAGALVASAFTLAPATAQEPESAGSEAFACGQLFTDPAEDADLENLDLIGGGIAATDDSTFTVELQVKNLTTDLPLDATGLAWYFLWTHGDVTYFANATYSLWTDEVTYNLGTLGGTPPTFSTTDSTEGTFTEGEEGTITVVVPREAVGSPASGDVLTQTYGDTRVRLSGPVGGGLVSQVDRGPDGDAFGTDYTVGTCGGDAEAQPPGKNNPPGQGNQKCAKIKNKQKKKKCLKNSGKQKGKNKNKSKACGNYQPGELGAEAETIKITEAATEEEPLEQTVELDFSTANFTPTDPSTAYFNVQMDTKPKDDVGLWVLFEFPTRRDYDITLLYPDGSYGARASGFNTAAETGLWAPGHGSEYGHNYEKLLGIRTARCGGWTVEAKNYHGEGGEFTIQLWLGDIETDPLAPGEETP